jgi:hypothetical protein
VVLDLPFVRRVKNLGAPWIVTSDANGDDVLLLDDSAHASESVINLIVSLVEQRATLAQFRESLDPTTVMIVSQNRTEVRGTHPRGATGEELIVE